MLSTLFFSLLLTKREYDKFFLFTQLNCLNHASSYKKIHVDKNETLHLVLSLGK